VRVASRRRRRYGVVEQRVEIDAALECPSSGRPDFRSGITLPFWNIRQGRSDSVVYALFERPFFGTLLALTFVGDDKDRH
jgi:hypothetical protein